MKKLLALSIIVTILFGTSIFAQNARTTNGVQFRNPGLPGSGRVQTNQTNIPKQETRRIIAPPSYGGSFDTLEEAQSWRKKQDEISKELKKKAQTIDKDLHHKQQLATASILGMFDPEVIKRHNLLAIQKTSWTYNEKPIQGRIIGYKNGKVSIQRPDSLPYQLNILNFSYDDQILIRAYIDLHGIPTYESQLNYK